MCHWKCPECKCGTFLDYRVRFCYQVPATWNSVSLSRGNLVLSKCEWCVTNQEVKLTFHVFGHWIYLSVIHLEEHCVSGVEHKDCQTLLHMFCDKTIWLHSMRKRIFRCGHSIDLLGDHNCRVFGAFWQKKYFFQTHSLQKFCKMHFKHFLSIRQKYIFEQSLPLFFTSCESRLVIL